MAAGIEGRLEGVVDGRAVGWAWNRDRREEAVEVEVLVDDEPVASGRADVDRPALAAAGIGTGRHGFDVQLSEELTAEPEHSIRVVAGPEREPLIAVREFENIVRAGADGWQRTKFVPGAAKRRPFVPEPEDPHDPGEGALVGQGSWLFPFDPARLGEEQLLGAPLVSPTEIAAWRDAVVAWRRQLKERRVPYLFAVAPLKERVYRQHLPPGAELHESRPVCELDEALRAVDGGHVLDLLPALREARGGGLAFPRTDSCWSDRGAFFAYRELLREGAKRVVELSDPLLLADAGFVSRQDFRGDLAGKPRTRLTDAGFGPDPDGDEIGAEEIEVADVSRLRSLRMPAPPHLEVTDRAPRLYEIPDEHALPRAVVVGDESCLAVIPWLAEHFSRFVFLWTSELPLDAIELEAPAVVIHLVSEQRLLHAP